jgi:hypothetical protein
MQIAVLSANLGGFDTPVKHTEQDVEVTYHTFTYDNFPQIADLPPRFQYRIPKLFGWQMFPGYDCYIWLDSSMQLTRPDSVSWFIKQLGDKDIAFFKHPWRKTVKDEVDFIEERLKINDPYITPRYKNGLHKEFLEAYGDNDLYASPVFTYKTSGTKALWEWWTLQSRYYTCDQVALSQALKDVQVAVLPGHVFRSEYIKVGSKHR